MILFVSDLHLGRGAPRDERAEEADLVAYLEAHASRAHALCLVGDVFDQFIEYSRLVPKGFVRFQAVLAAWTDSGVPVTYVVGNHDPWHRDYFAVELGVRLIRGRLMEDMAGHHVYVNHGSGLRGVPRLMQGLLRHPVTVWVYRNIVPGDAGVALAAWISRRRRPSSPASRSILEARSHAREVLGQSEATVAIMGHTHHAELCPFPEGVYLNVGSWRRDRTFGALTSGRVQLQHWNGRQAIIVEEHAL